MKKNVFFKWCLIFCVLPLSIFAKNRKESSLKTIVNPLAQISFDLHGGAIVDFHLKSNKINPFTWKVSTAQMPANNKSGAVFQGHFLCLGRWGAPTDEIGRAHV